MSYEITGILLEKSAVQQKTETFKTREFVIEKTDDIGGRTISNYIKFQSVQDKTELVDKFNIGDKIKVYFNIRGTKWNKDGRELYFTNLDAWRIESEGSALENTQNNIADKQPDFTPDNQYEEPVDDLPF